MFELTILILGLLFLSSDIQCRRLKKSINKPLLWKDRFFVSEIKHLDGKNLKEYMKKEES